MSETFTWIFNTAGDPGSRKIPPDAMLQASTPSVRLTFDATSFSANAAAEAKAGALLAVAASFLDAAERAGAGAHANKLRVAGLKMQNDAADLIQRSAAPTRK